MFRFLFLAIALALLTACGSLSPAPRPTTGAAAAAPPLPTASPTPDNIQYRFDDGVTPAERDVIKQGMQVASDFLGDVGPVTVIAYADLDSLMSFYARSHGLPDTSPSTLAFRTNFTSLSAVAAFAQGEIWILVSNTWRSLSSDRQTQVLVHQYYHLKQWSLAHHRPDNTRSFWLTEGSAEFVGYAALASKPNFAPDRVHADKVTGSRGMTTLLRASNGTIDAINGDKWFSTDVGYLAVEYLVNKYGGGKLQKFDDFWSAQANGADWETAFQQTFGFPVTDFYDDFESYRSREFPPHCGTVGDFVVHTTTTGPLNIELPKRLPPGAMSLLEKPWTEAPNIPYVFCVPGMQLDDWPANIYDLPPGAAGAEICGGGCVTVYMKPTAPGGTYNFSIKLPDQRHAEISFQHTP